jgi:hypothetical protein
MRREDNPQTKAELEAVRANANEEQGHVEWLQNECDAAKAKIEELNQASHLWRTTADRLNRELQSVYASKSWRITWPLRKAMQTIKWVGTSPVVAAQWAFRLPRRIVKATVIRSMRKALASPSLKSHALNVLANYPGLKQYLRKLAMRSGLMNGCEVESPANGQFKSNLDSENTVGTTYQSTMTEESIKNLSPRAARIYFDLKRVVAREKRNAHRY